MTDEVRTTSRAHAFGNRSTDIRVDWFRLLTELKQVGYSLYAVSHFTEIPKGSLNSYKQGTQPPHHKGVRLVEFWAQALGKDVTEVPMVDPYSFKA